MYMRPTQSVQATWENDISAYDRARSMIMQIAYAWESVWSDLLFGIVEAYKIQLWEDTASCGHVRAFYGQYRVFDKPMADELALIRSAVRCNSSLRHFW